MPLVEVVAGEDTSPDRLRFTGELISALGKTPIMVHRDHPGFVWNRLQFAVIREATALVQSGVVSREQLDQIVRDGLARRWRHVGPFQAIALGGVDTWNAAARAIVPDLSSAATLPDLATMAIHSAAPETDIHERDRALASDLVAARTRKCFPATPA